MCRSHLTGTTCVQAGRMEFGYGPNLSTCWSAPVRPVALFWLVRYYPAPITNPTHFFNYLLTRSSVCLSTCPSGLRPPSVVVHQNTAVRLEGETFEVTCISSSTTHLFNLTWVHLAKKVRCHVCCRGHVCQRSPVDFASCFLAVCFIQDFAVVVRRVYHSGYLFINSTLTVSAVSREDGGTYTCKGANEGGVTTATVQLRVLGK